MIGADTFNLKYNAENQLVEVKKNSVVMTAFVYDGDGRQVKATVNGVTTLYVGGHYEIKGNEVSKYYFAGAGRIAMRRYVIPQTMTLNYLLSDHLGSTSLVTDNTGTLVSEARYKPCPLAGMLREGEVRYSWIKPDLNTTPAYELTKYTFTGQRSEVDSFGLMFYNARWYDGAIGRFAQADSIVPNQYNSQSLDRYGYVLNNPLRYTYPSGHRCAPEDDCETPHGDKQHDHQPLLNEGGEKMNSLYNEYRKEYPGSTYIDFIVWVFSGEFSGLEGKAEELNPDLSYLLAHTASHWLYLNHGYLTKNTVLNWLWAMDSGKTRWNKWQETGIISGYGSAKELASRVVNINKNAADEWKRDAKTWENGTYWNGKWNPVNLRPHGYPWGNASLYPTLTNSQIEAIIGQPVFKWGSGPSAFYIFTLWQSEQLCPYNPNISGC